MRLRFSKSGPASLVLSMLMLLVFALSTAIWAQDPTAEPPTATLAPTLEPTSEFSFELRPTIAPITTGTALPSFSGVGGTAVNAPVSIRSGPGLEYARIGALAQGRSIDIIGYNGYDLSRSCSPDFESDLDMWVMVRYRERIGWMARCALEIRGEYNMPYLINNAPPAGAQVPTGYPVTGTPRSGT